MYLLLCFNTDYYIIQDWKQQGKSPFALWRVA